MKSKTFHCIDKFAMTSKTRHDVNKFADVMMSITSHDVNKFAMTSKSSSNTWHDDKRFVMTSNVYHKIKNISLCQWHQKHVFIIFCSQNDGKKIQDNISRSWNVKKWSCHQIVCHVIKNFHNAKTFTLKSNMLDTLCLLWRHKFVMMSKTRHDCEKSVCPDFKMLVMMSKYVMRSNGSSLLQQFRHDFNKTSTRQNVCHSIKRFVMTSKMCQKHQKICHDVKNVPNVCYEIKNMSWCQKVCYA